MRTTEHKNASEEERIVAETYPTGLAQWLKLNRISECQLAREVGITPTALGNLARGRTASVNKRILDAVAHRTQLSFDQILRAPVEVDSLIATGDHRIDLCLGSIGKYLHTPEMREKCRRYISAEFSCSGARYDKLGQPSVGFDQMCALNEMQIPKQYTTVLTAVSWYTPHGIAPHDSRILHTYYRTVETSPTNDPRYGDNFVVYEFEQSINEMSLIDVPKITSWWWDQVIDESQKETISSLANRKALRTYHSDDNVPE